MAAPLPRLDPDSVEFPDPATALLNPDGLLAYGGDLGPARLLSAYRQGIFPWYSEDEPLLWWSPDPRMVLFPKEFHCSRSLRKLLLGTRFRVTTDQAFHDVVVGCAQPRTEDSGTWITGQMVAAYCTLHNLGYAHSLEVWDDKELVGGVYGIALGKVFYGESMFSKVTNASKTAMAWLVALLPHYGFTLIDCQLHNPHLASLGARLIPRVEFRQYLTTERIPSAPDWPVELPETYRYLTALPNSTS
mgnify:CR=1 FL=1